MKRLLLPASALVLVVTACGAGAKPAPRVTQVAARVSSVRVVAARRERAAAREARGLLRKVALPPGARAIEVRPGQFSNAHVLHQSAPPQPAETVDLHRFWSVPESLKSVAAFVRAHTLRGFGGRGATYGTTVPHYLIWGRSSPAGSSAPRRFLTVTGVGLGGRTVVRVDVQVVWIYPRSPTEKIPAATREVVVGRDREVKDPAQVDQIVRWIDALPVSPPGVRLFCPLGVLSTVRLSFRSAGGAWLAQAVVPRGPATVCEPIGLAIGGLRQTPLVDGDASSSLVERLQRLLGIELVPIHRG